MIEILKLSNKSSLFKDSAKLASSNILLYLLPFVVTPILSRLYGPSYFGEWGVFSSTYQMLHVILFLCYDHAIVKVTEKEYPNMCMLSLVVSLMLTALCIAVFYICEKMGIEYFVSFPCRQNLFLLLLFTSITVILQNVANRLEKYWVMSSASIVLGLSQALCRILFGLYVIFPNGLIAGTTIAQALNVLFLLFFVGSTFNRGFFSSISAKKVKEVALVYKKFPLFDAPATLLLFATFNLTIIVLSLYYTRSEIGCLSIIHQMLLLPISLVGGAMGKVFYKQITDERLKDDSEAIGKISTKMIKTVVYLSVVPSLFITLGGDKLINIFLGAKWENAGNVAICLAIWSIPNILTQPLVPIFRKNNKQNYMLYFNVLNFVLGVGTLVVTCMFGFPMFTSLFLYAVGSAISNYLMFVSLLKLSNAKIANCFDYKMLALHILTVLMIIIRFETI